MPVIRSLFKFEQFQEVLQRFAYQQAMDALANLSKAPKPEKIIHKSAYGDWITWDNSNDVVIKSKGPDLTEVSANRYLFRFYRRHIIVSYTPKEGQGWRFEVREKLYTDSNHNSSLSYASDGTADEKKKTVINGFIEELMKDVQPIARYSLAARAQKYIDKKPP